MIRPLAAGLALALVAGQFATDVDLVEVYATVTAARGGAPIGDLQASDFEVRDDGVLRPVTVFAAGEFPLSAALALDRSFSMAGRRLALARSAAHVFLGALRPADRALLIAIGGRTETLAPLSTDRRAQHAALERLTAWGTTPLHDAIIEAIDRIQPADGRRALVILSDGDDRYSAQPAGAVVARARASDVLIYPIALGEREPVLFDWLASITGGRAFHLRRPEALAPTLSAIADELRHQYLLGYVPEPAGLTGPRAWRTIQVRVKRPDVVVRARTGYFGGARERRAEHVE